VRPSGEKLARSSRNTRTSSSTVKLVERNGDEAELLRLLGVEHPTAFGTRPLEIGRVGEKAACEPRQPFAIG